MNSTQQIAAFLDLDGTLLAPPSLEWRFIGYLLARGEVRGLNLARWLAHCAATILNDQRVAIKDNKRYLAGLPESLVADWSNSHAARHLLFFPQGLARIAWHHAQKHQVFLVTGTLEPLARSIARMLPCPTEVCATELEVRDSQWTGLLAGSHMSGETKAHTIRAIAERRNIALVHSFAYGNHIADLPMLEAVGHPVAVNPSSRLTARARKNKWQICEWDQPQRAVQLAHKNLLTPEQAQ